MLNAQCARHETRDTRDARCEMRDATREMRCGRAARRACGRSSMSMIRSAIAQIDTAASAAASLVDATPARAHARRDEPRPRVVRRARSCGRCEPTMRRVGERCRGRKPEAALKPDGRGDGRIARRVKRRPFAEAGPDRRRRRIETNGDALAAANDSAGASVKRTRTCVPGVAGRARAIRPLAGRRQHRRRRAPRARSAARAATSRGA